MNARLAPAPEDLFLRSVTCSLAAARATERRAKALLVAAVAPAPQAALARDIYARAARRSERLQRALELVLEQGDRPGGGPS